MQFIQPKVEIIEQEPGIEGIYKQIELAGRTCYKSEDKITKDSCKEFVLRMIDSRHGAMLEHGTVYLRIPVDDWRKDWHEWVFMFPEGCPWIDINSDHKFIYISTNYRHFLNVTDGSPTLEKYFCEPTDAHEKRISVRFTCDRGVSHELVRHRVFSFAQESTRYCNYSKDKFGNELTFIIPSWEDIDEEDANSFVNLALWGKLNDEGEKFILYYTTLQEIEATYLKMLKDGFKPQQARQILPNALKTEVVMTGFVRDWDNFFELRCAPNAHPDMKYLADKLKEEFISKGLI